MSQTRRVDFARLNIEFGIARQVDLDSVIRNLRTRIRENCLYNS